MRIFVLVLTILAYGVLVHGGLTDKLISTGKWIVEKIELCENPGMYTYETDLHKKKVNRTHDGFFGEMDLLEDLTEDGFGISIVACKKVDGGCKIVNTMEDVSFCRFVEKHAADNFKNFLEKAGAEGHCPVPKGHYVLKEFMFDNTELPEEGMVGSFKAEIVLTKNMLEKLACLALHMTFDESEDDEDE